jgi:hypothetical protein
MSASPGFDSRPMHDIRSSIRGSYLLLLYYNRCVRPRGITIAMACSVTRLRPSQFQKASSNDLQQRSINHAIVHSSRCFRDRLGLCFVAYSFFSSNMIYSSYTTILASSTSTLRGILVLDARKRSNTGRPVFAVNLLDRCRLVQRILVVNRTGLDNLQAVHGGCFHPHDCSAGGAVVVCYVL